MSWGTSLCHLPLSCGELDRNVACRSLNGWWLSKTANFFLADKLFGHVLPPWVLCTSSCTLARWGYSDNIRYVTPRFFFLSRLIPNPVSQAVTWSWTAVVTNQYFVIRHRSVKILSGVFSNATWRSGWLKAAVFIPSIPTFLWHVQYLWLQTVI